jgi:hypothetical protein
MLEADNPKFANTTYVVTVRTLFPTWARQPLQRAVTAEQQQLSAAAKIVWPNGS